MGTFDHLQHKRPLASASALPAPSLSRPSRQFAPLPLPTAEQETPVTQAQLGHAAPLQFSIDRISIFPPAKNNNTGIPDTLKAGVESFSSMAMDDVNSLGNNSQVIHRCIPFSATIQRVDSGPSTKKHLDNQQLFHPTSVPMAHLDAGPGKESKVGAPLPEAIRHQPGTDIPEPEEGQTVHLPDITYPSLAKLSQTDTLSSVLTYSGTITQTGEEPEEAFGRTRYEYAMKNITVTYGRARYQVHATLDHQVTFQVRKTTGPHGQRDISSPESVYITNSNYADIAEDLTPDMRVLGGCPPRFKYWAKDITVIHERFHAEEGIQLFSDGMSVAQRIMDRQTVSSLDEVKNALSMVLVIAEDFTEKRTAFPENEERAYGAGAHLYRDRVKDIISKGKAGQYPRYPRRPSRYPVKSKGKTGGSVSLAKGAE